MEEDEPRLDVSLAQCLHHLHAFVDRTAEVLIGMDEERRCLDIVDILQRRMFPELVVIFDHIIGTVLVGRKVETDIGKIGEARPVGNASL